MKSVLPSNRRAGHSTVLVAIVVLVTTMLATGAPVGAETPSTVVEQTADDGVYIASSRRNAFDPAMFDAAIADAASQGIRMIVAVPFDPVPSTTAFARRIRELSDVDVAIVFGPDGVFGADVGEDWEDDEIRAINAGRDAPTPTAQVDAFLVGLTTEPERQRPEIIDTVVRWIVILVLVMLAAAILEQVVVRATRARRRVLLRRARQAAGDVPAGRS